ncbi:MAG: hypothetical protein SCK28_02090 [Bacillota bacterium]|nr:hypothetical protein [Bacillota bacterium]
MTREEQNIIKVRQFLNSTDKSGKITIKQLAKELNMPLAEAAQAVQSIEFNDEVDS